MFKQLQPILVERPIHIMLSGASDGRISVFVKPMEKDDKEAAAFSIPFRCEDTAEVLEAELAGALAKWVASRHVITTSLAESLAAAEAETKVAAEEAKKKAAEKSKGKVTATAVKPTTLKAPAVVKPSLLDTPPAPAVPVDAAPVDVAPVAAAVVAAPATIELF